MISEMSKIISDFLKHRSDEFSFKDGVIGGDDCVLITPNDIKCKWNNDNLMFRSIIIRKLDNKIISRGYDKFFNWSEKPDIDKFPDGPFEAIEKKDGSLIIWGIHNEELIHRTRGTFDLTRMDNGNEISFLKSKYHKFIPVIYNNPEYSILTEWQTTSNVIVINEVNEPTLTLVGIIHNDTGKLTTQKELDYLAKCWGLNRPDRYHYNTIAECIADVNIWNGKEGVVIYSEDGQKLRKCKSEWYCELHKLATGIKGIKQVLDLFMVSPVKFNDGKAFYDYIEQTLDYEIAEKCKDFCYDIAAAYSNFQVRYDKIKRNIEYIKTLPTRKEQALQITKQYKGWSLPLAFLLLDNKEVDDKLIRMSIESILDELN